ncbi:hypothetical protein BofuT4_P079520.1 [Botrytis cinerea T4]|uniref:Casein kinase ii beta 2 subunit protein n=2 Tax=Botryotinia fuckeliana TaxID=40559 RepID=G2YKK9_BOTF4|nr:hypothetical protein BofuT4_P079520.1 [Botrytis cinerea T4]
MTPMGEKRYRAVSSLQEETTRKIQSVSKFTPGSYIDFAVNPTVTALSPLAGALPFGAPKMSQAAPSLNTSGFLDILSVDFSRALKDLAVTMNDLKKLSSLGDLPITLENNHILRIRFPGCDAESVERLCDEVGVQRGIVHQDAGFDAAVGTQMALQFPFAPTAVSESPSPLLSPCLQTTLSSPDQNEYDDILEEFSENPWVEGYETMDEDISESGSAYFTKVSEHLSESDEYEGLEGIYKFLEECDARRP